MRPGSARPARMRFGAATGLRPLPAWKQAADFLFVQIGFSLEDLLAWRAQRGRWHVPVYAGVIVVASAGHGPQRSTSRASTSRPASWSDSRRIATPASSRPAIW